MDFNRSGEWLGDFGYALLADEWRMFKDNL
jgi:hypothetical protein